MLVFGSAFSGIVCEANIANAGKRLEIMSSRNTIDSGVVGLFQVFYPFLTCQCRKVQGRCVLSSP